MLLFPKLTSRREQHASAHGLASSRRASAYTSVKVPPLSIAKRRSLFSPMLPLARCALH